MNFGIPYFPPVDPIALAILVYLSFAALAGVVILVVAGAFRGVVGTLKAYDLHLDSDDER